MFSGGKKRELRAVKGKIEIGQRSCIYQMQDVYADSNEGMVVKLIISVGQGEKKTPRKPTQVRVNWFQNLV